MTVEQLITALCQFPPTRRVVIPGRPWRFTDIRAIEAQRLALLSGSRGDESAYWIPHLLRRSGMRRESCVVLTDRPSATDPRRPKDLGTRRYCE